MSKTQQEIATPKVCKQKKLTPTQKLTYIATLSAIALICKILGNYLQFGPIKITIVYIPWIVAGMVLGPFGGMAVSFATDILGTILVPTGGSILPLVVLSNTLFPVFPAIAWMLFKGNRFWAYPALIIGVALSALACTLGISTYGLYPLFKIGSDGAAVPYLAFWLTRLTQLIGLSVSVVGVLALVPVMRKLNLVPKPAPKNQKEVREATPAPALI